MDDLSQALAPAPARPATLLDAEAVGKTLAEAFADDPLICFLMRDAARRPDRLPRMFSLLFRLGLPLGGCDVTEGYEAAALWRPPGQWAIHWWDYILNAGPFLSVFGLDAPHVIGVMDTIEKVHPKTPHWYLQAVGTLPRNQGKGFGGRVIRRRLALADAAGAPCYLESSKESNIPVYQSLGFKLTGEIRLPGGPVLYPMWRDVGAGG